MITTIFAILIGATSLGKLTPGLTALGQTVAAANVVFQVLDRKPAIDSASSEGDKPDLKGKLEFREVRSITKLCL